MYRIAIVEDDEKSLRRLKEIVETCSVDLKAECQVDAFKDGMDFITDYKPIYDLVFLDIEMPLLNGMDAAKRLRQVDKDVVIVFITNLMQYAIKGYEVEAVDYVLKPVEYKSFFSKFKKFIDLIEKKKTNYVILKFDGVMRKVDVNDIIYIEIIGHFLHYHLRNEIVSVYGTIAEVEQEVMQYGFFRIYKSYVINLDCIKELKTNSVILDDGTELLLSRFKKKEFMQKLTDYFGDKLL